MGKVIKKGGRRQAFSPIKIRRSIQRAAKEAGFSPAKIRKTVREVGDEVITFYKKKRLVPSGVLRRSVLGRIERRSKATALAWRRQEKRKRKKKKR